MRFALLLFVTAVVASPFPANDDVAVAAATSSGAVTKTRHHNHHKEPTPTFKLACNCKKPIIPAGQMDAKEVSGGYRGNKEISVQKQTETKWI